MINLASHPQSIIDLSATKHQQAIVCCPVYLHQNTPPSFSLAVL
ncbi:MULTISPECIES: hypothetical protein [unclassified Bartonella]